MISDTVKQLQQHKRNVLGQIDDLTKAVAKLEEAIALVSGVGGGEIPASSVKASKGKKGGMSAAGRVAIIAAQKARWAKYNAAKGKSPAAAKPAKKKVKISAAGIARIKAAQRARWAAYNAAKAKSGRK